MKIFKALFSRVTFMILMVILEVVIFIAIYDWFGSKAAWIGEVLRILSVIIVLNIINNSRHLSSDMIWFVAIVIAPVPATGLYLLLGANLFTSSTYQNIVESTEASAHYYRQDPAVLAQMKKELPEYRGQFHYISSSAGFPFYRNTGFDYYDLGEKGYPVMLEELRKAKKFIFLEYFIIEEGEMWNGILDILKEKAAAGLDVRVLYDDMGSFATLSLNYARKLEEKGIKCIPFNRINPILGIIMNHRDHRKIMVIDGKTAFSGGVNLADEYINVKKRFGNWKDNIIRMKGEVVWSYTVMFLTHWNALRKTDEDFEKFHVAVPQGKEDGYVAAYGETPFDGETTAQNIYMTMLDQANEYCYIYTPYLIIDSDMISSLVLAAKRGVDVKLITPGIPDKKLVWKISRSYYRPLIEGGVKIYEYSPGFVHSKVFLADDSIASVGTVNLDYRSLYLHFENGTYLCASRKLKKIKKDFEETLAVSREVAIDDIKMGPVGTFVISIIRLLAPLM